MRNKYVLYISILSVLSLLVTLWIPSTILAADTASPEEVILKVREASKFLNSKGDAGLKEFMPPCKQWVWKDTYIWVIDPTKMTDAAHPIKPKLCGMDLAGLRDIKGSYFFAQFCEVGKEPNGGWVEYWWPKVGENKPSRKISYILPVPNTPYLVASGIYNESVTLDELKKLIK
ncbi:MAG: cache domain-containing protein [Desulfobacterales bacterium]|nr:cache domain-containing protein [Desulfobacterales bacterium]